jgi:hypothetical protein
VIIAGDVVYAEHAHEALLCVMRQHLNPTDGIVLCVNSRRNGSMDRFVMTAKASFSQVDVHHHFDADVSRMLPVAYGVVMVLVVVGLMAVYLDLTRGVSA